MRIAFAIALAVHALIHLMGFVKAFELASLAQLQLPLSRPMGTVWMAAALLLAAAAAALLASPRWFWLLGAVGVLASQVAITAAWRDARFGTIANLVTLLAVVYGGVAWGPFGLRGEYERLTSMRLATLSTKLPLVTEAELAPLPPPLQRYLRHVGVVGRPQVGAFRARFTGRIRGGPEAPWMAFTGEQHSFTHPPARYFSMQATMKGLPVEALHTYGPDGARMRVKLLSLFPVADAGGDAFTRTETVTLLNDLCIMAPATLVDPAIHWRALDDHSAEATYTNGPHTVRAILSFDEAGALVNFGSDDRPALAPDGVHFVSQRWSTPVHDYRVQGGLRLASRGEGRYAAPGGEYSYIQFDSLEVSYELGGE